MTIPTLFSLNNVHINYYSFMISLGKYNESSSAAHDLSTKIYIPNKIKDVNFKVLNMIARTNDNDFKCKFDSTACSSNQK